ncbi:2-hydroxyacid dehydrogenase [Hoeflea poritis]|uniref:Glyoxylate/hydroxypyruvate reductase A n=1 Tax=Hoeflea poritis TaxID=2993659 RepID=A0ABT4VJ15_9HYPH|nr:glyoxylate/hydroxypyruvate reductase A [Hoeflea poritis]MDA4844117.1 glyoxylate/hydroxypyruvate reductase A [Hoeflea poritis]
MTTTIPFVARTDEDDRGAWLEALGAAMPAYRIRPFSDLNAEERGAARVAIVADPDPADLTLLPNLEWIHSLWAGVERIVSELPVDGPKIVRLEDPQMAKTMAEAVLAWTFYLHRDMPRYRRQQDARIWKMHDLPLPSQRTIGILGLGNLGRVAAGKLLQQDFAVCGWSRSGTLMDGVETFSGPGGLGHVLAKSDIVVVLMPLTPETSGLLNTDRLSAMKTGASLINFARGPIVDSDALLKQLDRGHLDHAVLDVFDREPLPQDSPLWAHPSVTVLPHISGPTNRTTASAIVAANIGAYFETDRIPGSVDRARGY